MNVSPAMPMNSASNLRNRWSGFVQSAYPRCPPTDAISAAPPTGIELSAGSAPTAVCPLISGLLAVCVHVSGAALRERQRLHDTVIQLLTDPLLERGLLEGEVLFDGVVGDFRGLVVADDRR